MSFIPRTVLVCFVFGALFLLGAFQPKEQVPVRTIIENMYSNVEKIQSLKFTMKKKERVDGKILSGEQNVKFERKPKKIYTKIIAPNEGVEVLFVEGQNKNHAYINPNAFPYITLSLDPYGSIMRNNNHHTVHEVGFDYIKGIVEYIENKSGDDFNKFFQYKGDTVFNNRKCYRVLIDYTPFNYVNYTVKPGENLITIAYKLYVSDYMIMSINEDIDDYHDVKPGQVIKVPNGYCKRTWLFIDQQNHLPIVQIMYDEKGLFSKYEFYNVQVNPDFSPEEFTKGYKDYDF